MIVVIGQPVLHATTGEPAAAGTAARIALTAAARGADVQLLGKVGEDAEGEAIVLALARRGVGHVALLRDPARRTPVLVDSPGEPAEPDDDPAISTRLEPADASLRPQLDAGDVELGLRYLTEFRVLVTTEPLDEQLARVVTAAAGWSAAILVALVAPGGAEPEPVPDDAILLQAPDSDPEGAFDRLAGELAAAIDSGKEPGQAFRDLVTAQGWEPAGA